MTDQERAVLTAYKTEFDLDAECALAPYYHGVANAAGDSDVAYAVCKALKKKGLLDASGRAGTALLNAPSYWITDKGIAALEDCDGARC